MDEVKARLAGPALHMPGVQLDVEDAIEQVKERYPDRSHCVVSDWVWLDLAARGGTAGDSRARSAAGDDPGI